VAALRRRGPGRRQDATSSTTPSRASTPSGGPLRRRSP
jgi:hypothetical protein